MRGKQEMLDNMLTLCSGVDKSNELKKWRVYMIPLKWA